MLADRRNRAALFSVVVFVVMLVSTLFVTIGCGSAVQNQQVIVSGGYASDSPVKLVLWVDIPSSQKHTCTQLFPGNQKREVHIVVPHAKGMLFTMWQLDRKSFQAFATPEFGACYQYQGNYYYVAVP